MDRQLTKRSGVPNEPEEPAGPFENALRFQQRVQWFGEFLRTVGVRAGWNPAILLYDLCPCCAYPKLFVGESRANCFLCRLGVEKSLEGLAQLQGMKRQIHQAYDAMIGIKDPETLKVLWTAARKKHGELEGQVPTEYRFFI